MCEQHEAEAQRKMHAAQEVAYVAEKHLLAQEKALKQAQAVRFRCKCKCDRVGNI